MAKSILVTGEAGYIGSDTVLQLLLGGFKVVVVDNLDNDSEIAVRRVAEIAGEVGKKNLVFHKVDLRDKEALGKFFDASSFDAVIHFVGLKAVGESVQKPPPNNDMIGTINVLETMAAYRCKKGCGSSLSIEVHLELGQETQLQDLETEGQINKWWISLVSKLKSAANNQTPIYPDDLKAKTVLILGFTALLGLLGVSYRINGHGNMVPTALFHKPTNTFTFFLIIIMMIIYFAAIGLMLAKACPRIAKVLNVISFLCLLLGVTVLLWTLCPRSINWIPWAFFACPFVAAFGVAVYWRFTETSSSTASLGSSSHPPNLDACAAPNLEEAQEGKKETEEVPPGLEE